YSLLHEVADLAIIRREELEADDEATNEHGVHRGGALNMSNVDPSSLLEYPFCVDVNKEVIAILVGLLEV
mgnify:CR=1